MPNPLSSVPGVGAVTSMTSGKMSASSVIQMLVQQFGILPVPTTFTPPPIGVPTGIFNTLSQLSGMDLSSLAQMGLDADGMMESMLNSATESAFSMAYSSDAISNGVSSALGAGMNAIASVASEGVKSSLQNMMKDGSLSDLSKGIESTSDLASLANMDSSVFSSFQNSISNNTLSTISGIKTSNTIKQVLSSNNITNSTNVINNLTMLRSESNDTSNPLKTLSLANKDFITATTIDSNTLDKTFAINDATLESVSKFNRFTFDYIKNNITEEDYNAVVEFQSNGFEIFNVLQTTTQFDFLMLSISPVSFLMPRLAFCYMLPFVPDEAREYLVSYVDAPHTTEELQLVLNTCYDLTSVDIFYLSDLARVEDITKLAPLKDMETADIKELMTIHARLLSLFSNITAELLLTGLNLGKPFFVDVAQSDLFTSEIVEFAGMSPNAWSFLKNTSNANVKYLFSDSTKIPIATLTDFGKNTFANVVSYQHVRINHDTNNYLSKLDASTILELCNQNNYLAKFSTFTNMDICQTFLAFGDGRLDKNIVSDSSFKNVNTLATIFGVTSSMFDGVYWMVLKSLCRLSTVNLTKVVTMNDPNAIRILSVYNKANLKAMSTNTISFDYILQLPISILSTCVDMVTKPDPDSVPPQFKAHTAAFDFSMLKSAVYNKIYVLKNTLNDNTLQTMIDLDTDIAWNNTNRFIKSINKNDMLLISNLSDTIYEKAKVTTAKQYVALYEFASNPSNGMLDSYTSQKFKEIINIITSTDQGLIKIISNFSNDVLNELVGNLYVEYGIAAITIEQFRTCMALPQISQISDLFKFRISDLITRDIVYYSKLTNIFKVLGCIDDRNKNGLMNSDYLTFIASLTYEQLLASDADSIAMLKDKNIKTMLSDADTLTTINGLSNNELSSIANCPVDVITTIDYTKPVSNEVPSELLTNTNVNTNLSDIGNILNTPDLTASLLGGMSNATTNNTVRNEMSNLTQENLNEMSQILPDDIVTDLKKLTPDNSASMLAPQNSDMADAAAAAAGSMAGAIGGGTESYIEDSFELMFFTKKYVLKAIVTLLGTYSDIKKIETATLNVVSDPETAAYSLARSTQETILGKLKGMFFQ